MARLNDPQPPGESIEALKKRYIRQNREIARANSAQSLRIRHLESEATSLLEENIALREQVIKLTVELDRRDRAHQILTQVSNTKSVLETKLQEIVALVGALNVKLPPTQGSSAGEKKVLAPKPVEERVWRNQYLLNVEQEGLEAIDEDGVQQERKRARLSMDDVPILSPTRAAYDDLTPESDEDKENEDADVDGEDDAYPEPPVSSFLDMRPRRRRDSSNVINTTASILDMPIRPKASSPPPEKRTRRFEDISPEKKDAFGTNEMIDAFTFRPSKGQSKREEAGKKDVGERAKEEVKPVTSPTTVANETAADEVLKRWNSSSWSMVEESSKRLSNGKTAEPLVDGEREREIEREKQREKERDKQAEERHKERGKEREAEREARRARRMSTKIDESIFAPPVLKAATEDTASITGARKSSAEGAVTPSEDGKSKTSTSRTLNSAPRRALGPKTSNSDLTAPPQKSLPNNPNTANSLEQIEKLKSIDLKPPPEKQLSAPIVKNITTGTTNTTSDPESATQPEEEGGRHSRRARASVNYALPNLRQKMRRESTEEDLRPRKKSSRSSSSSSSGYTRSSRDSSGGTTDTTSRASSVDIAESDARHKRGEEQSDAEGHWRRGDDEKQLQQQLIEAMNQHHRPSSSSSSSTRKRHSIVDIYENPLSSPERNRVKLTIVDTGVMPMSYRRSSGADEESEEEEDERRMARKGGSGGRKRVSFYGGTGLGAGVAPEEREKGRSSFGGGGGAGAGDAGKRGSVAP